MESGQEMNLPNMDKKVEGGANAARGDGARGGEMKVSSAAMMQPEKSGAKKGMIIGMVCLAVAAVVGCAFGTYAMVSRDSEIAKVREECASVSANNDGAGTETTVVTCPDGNEVEIQANNDLLTVDNLHLIGDKMTKRKYYLAINDLEGGKDSREVDTYLIDITKLGTVDGVKKYDMSNIINQAVEEKVASLPDVLAEGTQNEMPKSSCSSFRATVGDVTENPRNIDWTIKTDWSELVPLTIYYACEVNNGNMIEMSLGTSMYSLDPNTGELKMLIENWY
ncbi:hypothetical protein IJJ37_01195 [Candidatus Saccharibacteria bacterium]|nr:hypothetical protein [Candidatus Saccharibacteria bacterium]